MTRELNEKDMLEFAAELARGWRAGDIVLLSGDLGAGKTTFVRGVLAGLGVHEGVRSPTFNLFQIFQTKPPVLHADLYRLQSSTGLGIEDYLDDQLCLIEWPDRLAPEHREGRPVWEIQFDFCERGRRVTVIAPNESQ